MPDCARSGLEETAEHAFYYCERVRPFWDHVGEWTARIEPKQLELFDVSYVVDNILLPFQGEKRVVFLAILAVSRIVIWTTRNKGLYDDASFSYCDLVLYFRHQLRVKIRCDRKRLDRITFSQRWVNAASLVVRKGAMLESSLPPLPAHGLYGRGRRYNTKAHRIIRFQWLTSLSVDMFYLLHGVSQRWHCFRTKHAYPTCCTKMQREL